jgi:putative two-component system response regulator
MTQNSLHVLIVDDDDFMLSILKRTLKGLGYTAVTARSGDEALERLRKGDIHLVITDWDMPGMDGPELCRAVRREDFPGYVYIIMLTGREGAACKVEGLDAGADDFLTKPLNVDELHVCLKTANRILALETRDVALFALAKLAESRDEETGDHVERVQCYARELVRQLAPEIKTKHGVDAPYIRLLYQTTPLHDLGKVAIPDSVLLKPGKLTPSEYEIMKTHAILGAQTLEAALRRFPQAQFLQMARDIAATHHEKFDGTGYPRGLAGDAIPLCGRIVALADVYDALTSRRVYKAAMSHERAKSIIVNDSGKHFDPDVVAAFLHAEPQFLAIHQQHYHESPPPVDLLSRARGNADAFSPSGESTILVVEDDVLLCNRLVGLLARTGSTILSANNVAEAKRIFTTSSPTLIVSDWEMPGGDGLELCNYVRSAAPIAAVYFIMLTIHSDQQLLLNAYRAGVDDFVSKPFDNEELLARVQAGLRTVTLYDELARKANELRTTNSQLATMNARLDRLAITDELTGLHNRRHAMFKLEEQWALAESRDQPLTVVMADIDHFKQINDTYGHATGDRILHDLANILREETRGSDTVCRIGGEEFLMILPNQTAAEAESCAERCRLAIERHASAIQSDSVRVTISMGIATRHSSTFNFPDVLDAADRALYAAKHAGRNRVHIAFTQEKEDFMDASQRQNGDAVGGSQIEAVTIDIGQIQKRCGGDQSFASAVMARFCSQADGEVERIAAALTDRNFEVVRRNAHNLKSMAAYVTAEKAADLSRRIEQLARDDQSEGLVELTALLREEVHRVVIWIEQNAAPLAIAV